VTSDSFLELARKKTSDWIAYSYHSWRSAGEPPSLQPSRVYTDPIGYSAEVYRWQEEKYESEFEAVFRCVRLDSELIAGLGPSFASLWSIYLDPWSVWKQLRPLFVFSSALNGVTTAHRDVAVAYVLGQGVPSMAVDRVLDTSDQSVEMPHLQAMLPFCLISYNAGITLMREAGLSSQVAQVFLKHTKDMYQLMWKEFDKRYRVPRDTSASILRDYIHKESRILSSVFFGIAIEWAFLMAGEALTKESKDAGRALRKVRQLNDEIIDLEHDFRNGITTFPILHCLHSEQCGDDMARLLEVAWSLAQQQEQIPADLTRSFHQMIGRSYSLFATAVQSLNQLTTAMDFIMRYFDARRAFEVSLVLNQRMSTLTKRAHKNWGYVADDYRPKVFRLLD
jgi:hypothetical protein